VLQLQTITYDDATLATTTTETRFIHGPGIDEPLAMVEDGDTYFYHVDGLGSIVAMTDDSLNIVQHYSYDSFGTPTLSDPAFSQPYTYTGREWDDETELYFYRARYYDSSAGRFIAKDPIGFAGGDVNLYAYVQNNPTNYVDPSGEVFVVDDALILSGLAVTGAAVVYNYAAPVAADIGKWLGNIVWNESNEDSDNSECNTSGKQQRGNPPTGDPGQWVEHPHGKQDRLHGPDGTPIVDIDYGHSHGQGSPHAHNWDKGVRGLGYPVSKTKK